MAIKRLITRTVLANRLNTFLIRAPWAQWLSTDPVRFPRACGQIEDREIVALFAALIAYGRVQLIGSAMEEIVRRMGETPRLNIERDTVKDARARFAGFVYRVTRGDDLARLWVGLKYVLIHYGTLRNALVHFDEPMTPDFRQSLNGFRHFIMDSTGMFKPQRSFNHFLPDPFGGSAIKRYNMLLRWMVRGPDEIDIGDWKRLGTDRLVLPLDTHTHRIALNLGLTERKQADWKTATEITEVLKTLHPTDPTRYDFALAHLGISGACPSRRAPTICTGCPINEICTLA